MRKLVCEICGGRIMIQSGGEFGVCESCGIKYSIDRMRKTINNFKTSPTESDENLRQLKNLAEKYFDVGAFVCAENIVSKILKIMPNDALANKQYDDLQTLKHFDIQNVTLLGCDEKISKIKIPDVVEGINAKAFESNKNLQEVIFSPNCRVRVIERGSFSFCSNLRTVKLPNKLEAIGDSAFTFCGSLTDIRLPQKLQMIERFTFLQCTALMTINFPEKLQIIGDRAFKDCTSLSSLKFPSELRTIKTCAFEGCSSLTSIEFPYGLKSIEKGAFGNCRNLKILKFPNGYNKISVDRRAFSDYDSPITVKSPNRTYITNTFELPRLLSNGSYTNIKSK